MITRLTIQGFKSIKQLAIDCKRINVFIGEPDTGKSNILEALGFLSCCGNGGALNEYVRMDRGSDLLFDRDPAAEQWTMIEVVAGDQTMVVTADAPNDVYRVHWQPLKQQQRPFASAKISDPNSIGLRPATGQLGFLRFYRFKTLRTFDSTARGALALPDGRNLVELLSSSKALRQLAADYFPPSGRMFVIKPHERQIVRQKQEDGVAVDLPYHLSSDTLQRMVFYAVALESNRNATLVFEDPEAHAFPYYAKHLGERIALDQNGNQFFLVTHSPYLLTAIYEKAAAADVAVFATYMRDFETRVKLLSADELERIFEADPFFEVSHLVEDEP